MVEIENRWNWGYNIHIICDGCGICCVEFLDDTDWGYVDGLMVHKSRQRQGIATRMMERSEEIVKEEGYSEIRLDVEKGRNFQFDWYKRLGYEVYDEDDKMYYMKKKLYV